MCKNNLETSFYIKLHRRLPEEIAKGDSVSGGP